MSCKNQGIYGKIADISQNPIVKGSDGYIVSQILYKGDDSPFKLTNFLGATGYFKNADATTLSASGSLESADLGKIRFVLTDQQTALLEAGEEKSFEVKFEDDSGVKVIQYEGKLQINERLF